MVILQVTLQTLASMIKLARNNKSVLTMKRIKNVHIKPVWLLTTRSTMMVKYLSPPELHTKSKQGFIYQGCLPVGWSGPLFVGLDNSLVSNTETYVQHRLCKCIQRHATISTVHPEIFDKMNSTLLINMIKYTYLKAQANQHLQCNTLVPEVEGHPNIQENVALH